MKGYSYKKNCRTVVFVLKEEKKMLVLELSSYEIDLSENAIGFYKFCIYIYWQIFYKSEIEWNCKADKVSSQSVYKMSKKFKYVYVCIAVMFVFIVRIYPYIDKKC